MANLNGHMLNPLLDFNFIVNTDIGLLRYIREYYQDEKAFKLDIVNKSDRELLSLLYSRKESNPLSVISTEENMSDIDSLYTSFFDNYKTEIIQYSIAERPIMDFTSMVISAGNNFGVTGYIAISDEIEEYEIVSHFGKSGFVDRKDIKNILTKDPYYIKDYRFFTDIGLEDRISAKKIYTIPTQYNIDYFEREINNLTSDNVFVMMGKDYKEKKENEAP